VRAIDVTTGLVVLLLLAGAPGSAPAERFDDLVRGDFFAGLGGDRARLDQAMKISEDALAVDPHRAPALVWHGAGLVLRAGALFRGGDREGAQALLDRGLAEMERASRLAPDDPAVLIPRAVTLGRLAEVPAFAARATRWIEAAVASYQRTLALQAPRFAERSEHARGELLAGIAAGLDHLGKTSASREYLRRIVTDVPSSIYSTRAEAWLSGPDGAARPQLTCVGCHME
jgi:hypothetical protein